MHNPARFTRNADGSVRIRLHFTAAEADDIERQAEEDDLAVIAWIYHMLLGD